MRGKTRRAEQHDKEIGNGDPEPTLTVAGTIGEVCAVSDDQTSPMVVDAGVTSTLVSKSRLETHCVWFASSDIAIPKMDTSGTVLFEN